MPMLPEAEKLAQELLTNYPYEDHFDEVEQELIALADAALSKMMRRPRSLPDDPQVEIDRDDGADLVAHSVQLAMDFYESYMGEIGSAFARSLTTHRR